MQIVEETSKNARKLFYAMILGCVYSWLTIATTTDIRLISNSVSSPLPIISTKIPIGYFYLAAPFALLCLYLYFHCYLENLWKGLASLSAIFPDGRRLEERAYPWILSNIVCRHFKLLKNRSVLARMKEWITIFLAWWAVPLTFIGFWLRYLPRHEWAGTWLHIGISSGSVALATIFSRICKQILRGKEKNTSLWIKIWREFYTTLTPIATGLVLFVISYGAINGVMPPSPEAPKAKKEINYFNITEAVPWAFQKVGYSPFANFREKDVSIKPIDYYKIEDDDKRFNSVKSAILKNKNLTFADMSAAFLVKADLRYANLQNAYLRFAKLQKAYLGFAKLQKAYLRYESLQKADLGGAKLRGAILNLTDLNGCNNLTQKQLDSACGNEKTILPRGLTIKKCTEKE